MCIPLSDEVFTPAANVSLTPPGTYKINDRQVARQCRQAAVMPGSSVGISENQENDNSCGQAMPIQRFKSYTKKPASKVGAAVLYSQLTRSASSHDGIKVGRGLVKAVGALSNCF
jgi:hypothetical protein